MNLLELCENMLKYELMLRYFVRAYSSSVALKHSAIERGSTMLPQRRYLQVLQRGGFRVQEKNYAVFKSFSQAARRNASLTSCSVHAKPCIMSI